MAQENFPKILQSISDYLYEEEANIDRKKIINIGTILALATIFMATDAFAKHRSHGSHGSHGSHSSHTSSSHSSGHSNHSNHASHESHESHASHSSSNAYHYSHASSTHSSNLPSHSNSGNAGITEGSSDTGAIVPPDDVIEGGMIDIRIPLTPPDSPLMGGENG